MSVRKARLSYVVAAAANGSSTCRISLQTEQGVVARPHRIWHVDPAHSSVEFEIKPRRRSSMPRSKEPSVIPGGNDRVGIRVRGTISRTEFGLTWQKALESGGFLVGEEVKLLVDISAVRAK